MDNFTFFTENLARKSSKKLLELKDKHKGSRIFCLGNGPSIQKTDLSLLKNEVVIGSNHVNKAFVEYGFFPEYCCITDRKRILELRGDKLIKQSKNIVVCDHMYLQPEPSFFTQEEKDRYIFVQQMTKKIFRPIKQFPFSLFAPKSDIVVGNLVDKIISQLVDKNNFSFDIVNNGVNTGCSVIFTAIQLAVHMGATEVYLLGVDADYTSNGKYFFKIDDSKFYTWPDFMSDPLKYMNPFFQIFNRDLHQKGIKFFNATIGGRLETIERKTFSTLF